MVRKKQSMCSIVLTLLILMLSVGAHFQSVYGLTIELHMLPWAPWKAPYGLKVDSNGMVWFTEQNTQGNRIGRFNPSTKTFSEFIIPTPGARAHDLDIDSSGYVWFTEFDSNKIGRLNPSTGSIAEFTIPTSNSGPLGIRVDNAGNVWFVENRVNKIGRRTPSGGFTEYVIPRANSDTKYLAPDSQGRIWFAETNSPGDIAVLDPNTGSVTEFLAPTVNCVPVGITVDHQGYVWFTEYGKNKIARFDPVTNVMKEFPIPYSSNDYPNPWLIAEAPDGSIWFSGEQGLSPLPEATGLAGKLDPALGSFEMYRIPKPPVGGEPHNHPKGIAADRSGNIWVALWDTDYLAQLKNAYTAPTAWISGSFLTALPLTGVSSSGPHGDQETTSTSFTPSLESITFTADGLTTYLLLATSQLWGSSSTVGASMTICRDGSPISGDMFSLGAVATHRHLATAAALDTPSAGLHTYTLSFKTDPGGRAFVSSSYLVSIPTSNAMSIGPSGDQFVTSTAFIDTLESVTVNVNGNEKLLVIGSSQLWNDEQNVGSSICVSRDGVRISGDMFSAGAIVGHRHLATALAVDSPPAGTYRYSLQSKTDPGGRTWISGTYLVVVRISQSDKSGPFGDESTTSKVFEARSAKCPITTDGSKSYLLLATSQLWNSAGTAGSSIAICRNGMLVSGDQFSLGPTVMHRHIACTIAVDTPAAGSHEYQLSSKTDGF